MDIVYVISICDRRSACPRCWVPLCDLEKFLFGIFVTSSKDGPVWPKRWANPKQESFSSRRRFFLRFYQRQRLAFAPMVTKSWGQCGPDLLQFLRNLADHFAPAIFGFSLDKNTPQSSAPSTQQAANYRKLLGQKYNDNRQRISTCIFEGITTRIYGITFNLTCSRQYTKWLSSFDTIGLPLFPILT